MVYTATKKDLEKCVLEYFKKKEKDIKAKIKLIEDEQNMRNLDDTVIKYIGR